MEIDSTDDDVVKKVAKDIYCTAPVIRMKDIARRVGRSIEELCKWRDEEFWLHDRTVMREQKYEARVQEFCSGVEDPIRAAAETLRMLTETRKVLEGSVKKRLSNGNSSPDEIRDLVQSQSKLIEMQNELYERLGFSPRKATPLKRRPRSKEGKFI